MMPSCWKGGCKEAATYIVHAQWTIFDYIEEVSCAKHLSPAVHLLWRKQVDGQFPVDVWTARQLDIDWFTS